MTLETFCETFSQLADAPNAIDKLRELVLFLGIHGKLASQSPDDEPAHALLKRSRAEMSTRMAARQAKEEKPAAPVRIDEMTFSLPAGWAWCRLVDLGQFINGLAFKPSDWGTVGRPIIRIQNLSGRNPEYNRTTGEFDASVLVRDGDILVSWSATLDAFIWRGEEGVLNQHIFRVVPAQAADKGFLFWLLKFVIRELAASDHAHGLVMSHINRGPFLAHTIPLPPLAEQKRICARVDELMALCDRLDAQQQEREKRHAVLVRAALARFADEPTATNLNLLFNESYTIEPADLRQAILTFAIEGRLSGGVQATVVSMEDLVGRANLKNGLSVKSTAGPATLACLPLSSMRRGEVNCDVGKPISIDEERAKPYLVRKGDVFIVRGNGSKDLVGRAGTVRTDPPDVIFPDLFIRVPLPSDRILTDYFLIAWNSPPMREVIERVAKTTSGIWKINQGHIAESAVPVPPLAEQRRIVARVNQLLVIVDQLEAQLAAQRAAAVNLMDAVIAELALLSPRALRLADSGLTTDEA